MFLLACFFSFISIIFPYYNQDPIMMGLSGSYNTAARGYQCVGVNPANLAFENNNYIGLFGLNFSFSNNLLTQQRLNSISGAFLDEAKKQEIIDYLDGAPIEINSFFNAPLVMNFSINDFAITSNINYFSTFKLSQDFLKLFLEGNSQVGEEYIYDLFMQNNFALISESSFTKAFNFGVAGLGFTVKYLRGLSYYNLEPTKTPYFQTNFLNITSTSTYVLKQNSGGEGLAVDLGFTTKRTESGLKFGMSLINFGGFVKWNKLDSPQIGLMYDKHESYIINLSINELNLQNLNSLDTDQIFNVEANTVYHVNTLPDDIIISGIEGIDYYCSDDDCSSYYINSDDYELKNLDLVKISNINTEYPTTLSMGLSKEINDNTTVSFDLLTGMDDSWGNSQNWRLSNGYIFSKDKNPIRLGFSYGGYDYKSFGFSYGLKGKKNKFNIDFGFLLSDSYNFSKTSGFNYGINMYWIN